MCTKVANKSNTPESLYIAMYGSVRPLLPRRTIITTFGIVCKEKRICGYNPPQCLVFLSVPPDVIERDPRIGHARIFQTVTMGNFPRISPMHQLSPYPSPFHISYLKAPPRLFG